MGTNQFEQGQIVGGRYEIAHEVGRGGVAIVYAAHDKLLSQEVAIKLLVPAPASLDSMRRRFKREAMLLRELNHPNIIRVHEYVEENDCTFLVMNLIRGSDLQRIVEQKGAMPAQTLERIAGQVVSALDAAHQRGILHRDIKPSNILIDENEVPYITDFGAAGRDSISSLNTSTGFMGTLSYSAPEIVEGLRADTRSDIYSLGLTLYFCAEAKLPPMHRTTGVVEPSIDGFTPSLLAYQTLGSIIAKSTRRNPALRFLSAEEMLQATEIKHWEDYLSTSRDCPVCESPNFSDDGICHICLGGNIDKNNLTALFIEENLSRKDRSKMGVKIREIFNKKVSRSNLHQVTKGEKALLIVPSVVASNIASQLNDMGLKLSLLHYTDVVNILPKPFKRRAIALCVASLYSIYCSFPLLGYSGLFLCVAGLYLGLKVVRRPLFECGTANPMAYSSLSSIAIELGSTLNAKGLRNLWGDVIRLSSRVLTLTEVNLDTPLANAIEDLVKLLGQAIAKLDDIDAYIDGMDNLFSGRNVKEDSLRSSLEKAERTRAALQDRIFRALSMFGKVASENLDLYSCMEKLDVAREMIESEVDLYEQARQEIENLMSC